jgi:spore coat protein U-like protein
MPIAARTRPSLPHRLAALLSGVGLGSHALSASLVALPLLLVPAPAQAACTNTSGASQNRTYTYTVANLGNEARIDFPFVINCTGLLDGQNVCVGATYTRSAANGANSVIMRLDAAIPVHSVTITDMDNAGAMYGPYGALLALGPSSTSTTITSVVPSGAASGKAAGTYTSSFTIYEAKTATTLLGLCGLFGALTGAQAFGNYTANFVIPKMCALNATPAINFNNVSSIGPTPTRIDAQGTVTVECNTPYTIYIGDGLNRVSPGSGNRRMAQGGARLPYQLFKDSGRTQVWDATGGTTAIGGSGGVSDTGTGAAQNKTVYASIPAGTTLPVPGTYTDTVVITVTY